MMTRRRLQRSCSFLHAATYATAAAAAAQGRGENKRWYHYHAMVWRIKSFHCCCRKREIESVNECVRERKKGRERDIEKERQHELRKRSRNPAPRGTDVSAACRCRKKEKEEGDYYSSEKMPRGRREKDKIQQLFVCLLLFPFNV
jgi:hypothetical protein